MAILGKRSRASPAATTPTSRASRAKRREVDDSKPFVIVSDDEENPFVSSRPKRKRSSPKYHVDIDELSLENDSPPKKRVARVIDSVSPNKENSPYKEHDRIPTTPRHRDSIKIAVTPRHRLLSRPSTPQSHRTTNTPRQTFPSVYNDARKLFRGSIESGKVIGREKELNEITTFISERFDSKSSGCIYVSGPPGTGKSALVTQILRDLQDTYTVQSSYCNCMSVKTAADIYEKLFDDFGVADAMKGNEMARLKKVFQNRKEAHLVILDEIDHLLDVDMELLYQLFEWSMQKSSSLVLVGIANALDLTDRFLPRLKSKNLRPQLVPFMPYSVTEISSIITSKLRSIIPSSEGGEPSTYVPFIHPTAILFLSKKVAAQTGDIRKAFAICLRALDIIESETQSSLSKSLENITPSASVSPSKTPLTENLYMSSPSKAKSPRKSSPISNPMAHLTVENAPRVTIAHMARVTATAFSNGLTQRLSSLNLQQKAALCALSALESSRRGVSTDNMPMTPSKSATSAPTVRLVYEAYSKLCKQDNLLHALSVSEFRDIMASLDTLSLISCLNGKSGSLAASAGTPSRRGRQNALAHEGMENQKVASAVGVKELKDSLAGAGSGILLTILDGDALL
jgi:cell division control protein 6